MAITNSQHVVAFVSLKRSATSSTHPMRTVLPIGPANPNGQRRSGSGGYLWFLGVRRSGEQRLSPASPLRRRYGLEELNQRDAEGARQPRQRGDPDVALAALDAADVVAVQTGAAGELLL